MSEVALEVRDLVKEFPAGRHGVVRAVDGVSFSLRAGECLALVGRSGCGKSTTARIVARLEAPTSGAVLLDGLDVTRTRSVHARALRYAVQMVFQDPVGSFDPRRTLGDGVAEPLRNAGMSRREADERALRLLARCGLSDEVAARRPHEVSGGQCQRAAIARAMAAEPRVLVCDEATSALDATVQRRVMELLGSVRRETGLACLFICHDLALVQEFCDRVLVMHAGRIVEEGSPGELLASPRTSWTRELADAVL